MGRPSLYTPELVAEIEQRLADGEPLVRICRDESMPAYRTVKDWIDGKRDTVPEVSAGLAGAREAGFDSIAVDALELLDAPAVMIKTQYGDKVDPGDVALRKARFEGRLKLLKCWDPKRYGDRTQVDANLSGKLDLVTLLAMSGIDDRPAAPAPYKPPTDE